jgi:carbon-monoxide dehydrogenase medium subunit
MKHPATLFALCGVAAAVQLAAQGTISDVRIAVTGAFERPTRLHVAEQALRGARAEGANASLAAAAADSQAQFVGDLFASAIYRRHLTFVLTDRALKRAIATATA